MTRPLLFLIDGALLNCLLTLDTLAQPANGRGPAAVPHIQHSANPSGMLPFFHGARNSELLSHIYFGRFDALKAADPQKRWLNPMIVHFCQIFGEIHPFFVERPNVRITSSRTLENDFGRKTTSKAFNVSVRMLELYNNAGAAIDANGFLSPKQQTEFLAATLRGEAADYIKKVPLAPELMRLPSELRAFILSHDGESPVLTQFRENLIRYAEGKPPLSNEAVLPTMELPFNAVLIRSTPVTLGGFFREILEVGDVAHKEWTNVYSLSITNSLVRALYMTEISGKTNYLRRYFWQDSKPENWIKKRDSLAGYHVLRYRDMPALKAAPKSFQELYAITSRPAQGEDRQTAEDQPPYGGFDDVAVTERYLERQ